MKYWAFVKKAALFISKNSVASDIICAAYPRVIGLVRKTHPLYGSVAMLSLTGKCQCFCPHCGVASRKDTFRAELSRSEVLDTISELAELGAKETYFIGGEPLLVPEICEYVSAAHGRGMLTSLDTNGVLLDDAMARALRRAGLDKARVSLDSPYEEEHDRLRGHKGLFAKVIAGIKSCKDVGLECHISACATPENLGDGRLKKITDLAETLGVKTRIVSLVRCGKLDRAGESGACGCKAGSVGEMLRPGKVYWETEFADKKDSVLRCGYSAKRLCYISHHGDVQPCIYMPVRFGNIRDEKIEAIIGRMWKAGGAFSGGLHDCPTNSKAFAARYGRGLSDSGGAAVTYESRASINSLPEWDGWAPTYQDSAELFERFNYEELAASADFRGKRVLDVGGGTGRFARAIAPLAAQVTVADFSSGMLKAARENLKGFGNADLKRVDIEKEDPAEGKYEAITAISVMHHISRVDFVVKNMKASLADGGRIIIVDYVLDNNFRGILWFFSRLFFTVGPAQFSRLIAGILKRTSMLGRHLGSEERFSLDDFKRRYEKLLPGAKISVKHGIYAYLVWEGPK